MQLLKKTLAAFNHPNKPLTVAQCMKSYELFGNTFYHDFFIITLDQCPDLNQSIKNILKKFDVLPDQQSRYLNQKLTVYEFLVELNEQVKQDSLTDFIELLSKRKNARWKNIALGSGLGSVFGILPFFVFQLSALQQVLSVASIVSCGGLIYSVAVSAYMAYDATDKRTSFYTLFRENFFEVAKNALTISAWSIMLIAAVTTPVVSILFVVADAALVIKEGLSLAYIYLNENPSIHSPSSLIDPHTQARKLNDFEKRKYSAWVNVVAAILLTAIIAAWCFVPGGIFVIAGSLLAMGGVFLTKRHLISENEKKMKGVLQEQFLTIEQTDRPPVGSSIQVSPEASNNTKMHAALSAAQSATTKARKTRVEAPIQAHQVSSKSLMTNSLFTPKSRDDIRKDVQHTSSSPKSK